jgi:hypothetical protein
MRAIDLKEAFLNYKAKHGTKAARLAVLDHGGAPGFGESIPFGSVPDENVAEFAQAIGWRPAPAAEHASKGRNSIPVPTKAPKTLEEQRAAFNAMAPAAFQKFNTPKREPQT